MDSVKTALRVLELVAGNRAIGVSELGRMTGEPKSTVQRCLVTLHEAGWLAPVEGQGHRKWRATSKLAELARHTDELADLPALALTAMKKLCEKTRETIHLLRRDGDQVVLISKLDSPQTLRTVRSIGVRAALHVSSNGKAILAALPPEALSHYISRGLKPMTDRSITDGKLLAADIEKTRRRGFALSDGELDLNVRAVAAAIRDAGGEPVASLSISCPAIRLPDGRVAEYGRLVSEAAAHISRLLKSQQCA